MSWTGSSFLDFFIFLFLLNVITYIYYRITFSYWKKRKMPYLRPISVLFGNLTFPNGLDLTAEINNMYATLRRKNLSHAGIYFCSSPLYIVSDLEYIKNILTKDFQHFVDRGTYYNEKDDPLGANLFSIGGSRWRHIRVKLTPIFTSGKMKMMFQNLLECETQLQEKLETLYQNSKTIEIKKLLSCFTIDVIGSVGFGLECNTFKEEDSPFRKYGQKVFRPKIATSLQFTFGVHFPKLARALKFRSVPKDISNFFINVVKETVEFREKNNFIRKDFMQLLIDLKNNNNENPWTIEDVASQAFIFFVAGYETSANTMTWALYELARHEDIQQKVREEIEMVLTNRDGKLTYEALNDMKYLTQVVNETLRKYPPLPFITRQCTQDYRVPDTDIIIQKGMNVLIPIQGIHHDEEYYPDPYKFDPERFTEENTKLRDQYAHMPFGQGHRICLGLRFGMMQTKVGIISLIRRYKFRVSKKTKEPIEYLVRSITYTPKDDVFLDAEKID